MQANVLTSKAYLSAVRPLARLTRVRYLSDPFDFEVSGGQMTPKLNFFSKIPFENLRRDWRHRFTCLDQLCWKSVVGKL